ncbi:MAG: hypothetical protein ACKVU1_07515 [bacterium]
MMDSPEEIEARRAACANMWTRVIRPGESANLSIEDDRYWLRLSPSERVALVWQLTVDAWEFAGVQIAEERLCRSVTRVVHLVDADRLDDSAR